MRQPVVGVPICSKLLFDFSQRLRVGWEACLHERKLIEHREFQQMRSHILSLQEQVDNLYANLNSLREQRHDSYPSIERAYSHEGARSGPVSVSNARTLPPLRKASEQRSLPQFLGPTSSAYGFDVAKSSLQTM